MIATLEPTTTTFAPELGIAELTLRNWRDESDYEKMLRVLHADKHSQGLEESSSVQVLAGQLQTLPSMNVATDAFLLEHAGEVIAYQTLRAIREADGNYRYAHHGFVLPEWKGRSIGRVMMQHAATELRRRAANHPADARKFFQVFVESARTDSIRLLEQQGYTPARYFYEMLRDNLDNLPDYELPEGIKVRPAQPEHYRAIWDALLEGFQEHWGEEDHTDEDYMRWLKRPNFQPHLWQVAWDGDRVVSMVINQIDSQYNAQYSRQRGFSEDIATLKEYRGRGIAQALIVRGFRQFKELGMAEAALDVDAENASGALRLYEKLGYRPTKMVVAYRKPL